MSVAGENIRFRLVRYLLRVACKNAVSFTSETHTHPKAVITCNNTIDRLFKNSTGFLRSSNVYRDKGLEEQRLI